MRERAEQRAEKRAEKRATKETFFERIAANQYKMPDMTPEEALEEWAAEMKEVDWKEAPKRLFFKESED